MSSFQSIIACVQCRQEQMKYLQQIMSSMQMGDVPSLSDSYRLVTISDHSYQLVTISK